MLASSFFYFPESAIVTSCGYPKTVLVRRFETTEVAAAAPKLAAVFLQLLYNLDPTPAKLLKKSVRARLTPSQGIWQPLTVASQLACQLAVSI